jgi:hypothetical protein
MEKRIPRRENEGGEGGCLASHSCDHS